MSSVGTISVSPVLSSGISITSSRTSPVSSGTIASGTVVALLTVFVAGDVLLFFFSFLRREGFFSSLPWFTIKLLHEVHAKKVLIEYGTGFYDVLFFFITIVASSSVTSQTGQDAMFTRFEVV